MIFETQFGRKPSAVARAPGRVNLIGEHTDYNGGLVLPAALELATHVELRIRDDTRVLGWSREKGQGAADLLAPAQGGWLDYVRGTARVLAQAGRVPRRGFELAVASDVPEGAGLSSSAALEVATALALCAAAGTPVQERERLELARWCRSAEADFVGVPCGLMDPFASACGQDERVLRLDCRTLEWKAVAFPPGLSLLIADTGVRRELRASGYARRRAECQLALEGARTGLGRELETLSEIRPEELRALEGALDPVALRRARHVVLENQRVERFTRALEAGDGRGAGELLYASHASLRVDYEVSCAESDALVELSRDTPGMLGARMTGAGFGGCTVHLLERERARNGAEALAAGFRARFGRTPRLWHSRPAEGARTSLPA